MTTAQDLINFLQTLPPKTPVKIVRIKGIKNPVSLQREDIKIGPNLEPHSDVVFFEGEVIICSRY